MLNINIDIKRKKDPDDKFIVLMNGTHMRIWYMEYLNIILPMLEYEKLMFSWA